MTLRIPGEQAENIMFLHTLYHKPGYDNDWKDMLEIVYKRLDSGEKFVHSIEQPTMDVYIVKDQYRKDYYDDYVPIVHTEKHTFPYKDLEMCIAKVAGEDWVKYLKDNNANKNRKMNKNIHKWEGVYGSDYDIEQWYRIQWLLHLHNEKVKPVTTGYLDIETDILGLDHFVLPGEVPINAITLIDEEAMVSHTLLLRNSKNPLIEEFEQDIEGFVEELNELFDETYGEIDYNIYMYDEDREIDLIRDLFRLVNTLNKDFILIWNMDFDIPYIIARIRELGYDPDEICTHPDFARKVAYYSKVDDKGVVANRSSRFVLSSYSNFICQMTLYAGMRKGQGELRSTALNAVGRDEIGDEKIDYSESSSIATLPYDNYRMFVIYNIKDVLLQMGIKKKTGDVEGLYLRSYSNCISYEKTFKQTKFLEDRGYVEYMEQGLVIGNNVNSDYDTPYEERNRPKGDDEEDEESFAGGLVADPLLNGKYGIQVFGAHSNHIYNNAVDFDFASMYPWITITFNIAKSTMIGKLIIDDVDVESAMSYANDLESNTDKGRVFLEDFITNHVASVATKWFGLPDANSLVIDLGEKLSVDGSREITLDSIDDLYSQRIELKGA